MISLIIGGIKSGKTKHALKLTQSLSDKNNLQKIYLATAQNIDAEMDNKIKLHKQERDNSWQTVEETTDIVSILNSAKQNEVIMIDCISMWLSNLLCNEKDIETYSNDLIKSLQSTKAEIIIVSNEVGHTLVADNKMGRKFQNEQGLLNQKLGEIASNVHFVIAGLNTILKGN
ncbi:MAG: bifunctional adenosylcobinamide kinase/adenosylcobinamide-phosphate guanylyltransferase [Alphaproteobacteria bacterium]